MSNRARFYKRINTIQNLATVVISTAFLFVGFSGYDKLTEYAGWIKNIPEKKMEFGFNVLVLSLFILGTLHLVFRFSEKQTRAEHAVAALAALGNEIEDMTAPLGNLATVQDQHTISLIRAKYEAIAVTIPGNTDREFHRARRDLARKNERRNLISVNPQDIFDPEKHEKIVAGIVLGSKPIVDILKALREIDPGLHLGGGTIRSAVWDYLHGYHSQTPVDDVDVVYFDKATATKEHDERFDQKLDALVGNLRWSTKNQARMHRANKERAYKTLNEAVARWPETATAFAVRLTDNGRLEFVTPHGLNDLLRMLIVATPAFTNRMDIVANRVKNKEWLRLWPRLKLSDPVEAAVAALP